MNKLHYNPTTLDLFLDIDWKDILLNWWKTNEIDIFTSAIPNEINRYRMEVTLSCNLQCSYCVVYKNNIPQINANMTLATAKKLVESFNIKIWKKWSIMIMWWEPLVNWNVTKYIIENCKWYTIMFTNWLLLDKEKIAVFKNHKCFIGISLDGLAIHNNNRYGNNKEIFFKKVCENIKLYRAAWIELSVACMVTNQNIDDVVKIARFFNKKLHVNSMSFNIPHFTAEDTPANIVDINLYIKKIIDLYEYAKKNHLVVYQIDSYLSTIFKKTPKIIACKAFSSQKAFYPNWQETCCTKIDTLKEISLDMPQKQLPIKNSFCENCIAIATCGWWCFRDNIINPNKGGFDKRLCKMHQTIFSYILSDIEKEMKHIKTKTDAFKKIESIYKKMMY